MLKNVLKNFQMSEQYWGCLDKMSEVNFSPAETLDKNDDFSSFFCLFEIGSFPPKNWEKRYFLALGI